MDIIAAILTVAKGGVGKTQIMYRANLSFKQLEKYLNFLMKKELLETYDSNHGKRYETSARGFNFLQDYRKLKDFLSESINNFNR